MKLSELQLREKVPTGTTGDTTQRLKSVEGPAGANGWAMDYDAGMVTATKGEQVLVIPMSNVAYMRPEPKPAKAVKVVA